MAKILVADDNEDLCELIDLTLARDGHDVERAMNGTEALAMALANGYDLVVLDIMMPRMSGLKVAEGIRADPVAASTRILLLSAMGRRDDLRRGYDVGADDYLTKPFELTKLSERVRMLIGDDLSIA